MTTTTKQESEIHFDLLSQIIKQDQRNLIYQEMVKLLKELNYAFYVEGTSKALKPVMAKTKELISKAEGQS